ncbi:hypothetical protein GCM10025881_27200 [Pseudolysinimonas kribbensis]|uniref:Uncharacterized protein n=1 Tax=Pseudolysinimonas kribbensis TaxID=433641 RepID=A0ABQ6K829_9MICO|nr:hypothetical protein GCM10025881_27200 [Pseudolysinimonas kribbensis]
MCDAAEGEEVVLAEGLERDVAHQHEIVEVLAGQVSDLGQRRPVDQLGQRRREALRRLAQPLACDVEPERVEQCGGGGRRSGGRVVAG